MESVPTETTMYIITYHAARDRLIGGVIVVMHPMNGISGIDNHWVMAIADESVPSPSHYQVVSYREILKWSDSYASIHYAYLSERIM